MSLSLDEIDDLLEDWGGYVRAYKHLQGSLHRHAASMGDVIDEKATRAAGVYTNPVLANLLAEEKAELRVPATIDQIVNGYPSEWRTLLVLHYVGVPTIIDGGRKVMLQMQWGAIERKLSLPTRDREAAMRMIRRQLRGDLYSCLPEAPISRWVDSHRVSPVSSFARHAPGKSIRT